MTDRPIPRISYSFVPHDGHNVFREVFGALSDEDWCEILVRSINEPTIEGVQFPSFPEEELQNHIHGNFGSSSLMEARDFFKFVKENTYKSGENVRGMRLLDFGTGWGRMIRPYMRDFEFVNLYGFEPDFLFCTLARALNPYINVFSGTFSPTGHLPEKYFNLVVSYSIFSHLSPVSAKLWLKELARILVPGGWCVFTTWGSRFLKRLQMEAAQRDAGEEIHWYSSQCIKAAGAIDQRVAEYERGDFVWFTGTESLLYGEAFVGQPALKRLLAQNDIPFAISLFDDISLYQDVYVLTRL